jgi:4-oxalocrotonate tautomerase
VPVVIVEMWEGRKEDQKRALVKAITDAMIAHAEAKPDHLHVIIHETRRDNWGRAGALGSDPEARAPAGGEPAGDPQLTHLLLQVYNLDDAVAFYAECLGFPVRNRSALRDGRPLVVLRRGLGLTVFPPDGGSGPKTVDHIAFRVPALEPVIDRLTRAGRAYEGPVTTPVYGTSIYCRDPDGNRIEFHDR